MRKKISIIGSTGSIGTQALEVLEKLQDKFEIIALAGGSNASLLKKQAEKFNPKYTTLGEDGLDRICNDTENDIILMACSGKVGLKPTLTAIKNGINVALANKETLVMAGDIIMAETKKNNVDIIPVDSEHCAIHQCIKNITQVRKLIITASGGPFLHKSVDEIKNATVNETLCHPKWNMGKKITVDSATLMNKGLEIIEAHHLFGIDYNKIEVVIHPQSIIHSAIEYADGSIVAQLGLPSMHIPIQYAISYPQRFEGIKTESFSFSQVARLDFEEPDFDKFPCLKLAYLAGEIGGTMPTCLNAANEEAVFAFLNEKIKLNNIYEIVEKVMSKHDIIKNPSIDEIFEVDKQIRQKVSTLLKVKY